MPLFDLPPAQLRSYESDLTEPADFDAFWDATIAEARAFPLAATFMPVENMLTVIDSFDVTFAGFGGDPVKGWLHLPANRARGEKLPVVVQYIGYSGGRGLVQQDTGWAQAGYAHFIMDTRGQGYGGLLGDTPDPHASAGGTAHPGLMTRGIDSREDYYYRRAYVDSFRAIEAAQAHPEIDPGRVIVSGISQGGGLTIAASGLAAGRLDGVIAVMPDVPFLQDFPRSIDIAGRGPYPEIATYLKRRRHDYDAALEVLNYFDGVHLARRCTAPALYSAAGQDDICPPSTVYGSFNAYGSAAPVQPGKDIEYYRFNNHEGGQEHQWIRQLRYVADLLAG
ncbi:cephalosporin-C deacetylase [Arthrobacter stackebrandtii]|uniref:Cephalosporin-C deacetylase n=1 Tax=Arthrobacter stackebrandtii TaxID=272161 RepID=A0ABS4YU70_9MICC|nr:acetylxylan esterase [Arthrobacter stackebrandtii]MBP2412346.1 cephalosporin-C deacetylase [Arthrobacter stackebrandtii]PYH02122.1 acetylxylan esterase [Arthrobacter stackebrandtii]